MGKHKGIYRRKDGRLEARPLIGRTIDGKAIYRSVYGRTYSEVREKIEDALRIGIILPAEPENDLVGKCPTFRTFTETFLERKKKTVEPATFVSYVHKVERLNGYFGNMSLEAISSLNVQEYIFETSEAYAPKTVSEDITLLRNILGEAALFGYCRDKDIKVRMPKKERSEYRILSDEDFEKLYEHCRKSTTRAASGVLTAMNTGMRIGEVCALRVRDIDFDREMISVTKSVKTYTDPETGRYRRELGGTKTAASKREIPISREFANLMKFRTSDMNPDEFILGGYSPHEPKTLRNNFNSFLDELGIKRVPFHSLRHGFATRMIERGVDPKTAAAFLGHANCNITLNIYTNCTEKMKRDALAKIWGG